MASIDRRDMVTQYIGATNMNFSRKTKAILSETDVSILRVNTNMKCLPKWPSIVQQKRFYEKSVVRGKGKIYKYQIKLSMHQILLLLLVVSFVLFSANVLESIQWTFQMVHIIDSNLFKPSANVIQNISDRKQLKKLLGLDTLTSSNMASIEKLINVRISMTKSTFWSSYSEIDQCIIVAFAYINAIQFVNNFTNRVSHPMRQPIQLLNRNTNQRIVSSSSIHRSPSIEIIPNKIKTEQIKTEQILDFTLEYHDKEEKAMELNESNKNLSLRDKLNTLEIKTSVLKFVVECAGVPSEQHKPIVELVINTLWANRNEWFAVRQNKTNDEQTMKLIEIVNSCLYK